MTGERLNDILRRVRDFDPKTGCVEEQINYHGFLREVLTALGNPVANLDVDPEIQRIVAELLDNYLFYMENEEFADARANLIRAANTLMNIQHKEKLNVVWTALTPLTDSYTRKIATQQNKNTGTIVGRGDHGTIANPKSHDLSDTLKNRLMVVGKYEVAEPQTLHAHSILLRRVITEISNNNKYEIRPSTYTKYINHIENALSQYDESSKNFEYEAAGDALYASVSMLMKVLRSCRMDKLGEAIIGRQPVENGKQMTPIVDASKQPCKIEPQVDWKSQTVKKDPVFRRVIELWKENKRGIIPAKIPANALKAYYDAALKVGTRESVSTAGRIKAHADAIGVDISTGMYLVSEISKVSRMLGEDEVQSGDCAMETYDGDEDIIPLKIAELQRKIELITDSSIPRRRFNITSFRIFDSFREELLRLNHRSANELADLYFKPGTYSGYITHRIDKALQLGTQIQTEFYDIYTKDELNKALAEILTGNPISELALEITLQFLRHHIDGEWPYIPTFWDYDKIGKNHDAYNAALKNFGEEDYTNVVSGDTLDILREIGYTKYTSEPRVYFKPEFQSEKAKWLIADFEDLAQLIITQSACATEHTRVFGEDGKIMNKILTKIREDKGEESYVKAKQVIDDIELLLQCPQAILLREEQ